MKVIETTQYEIFKQHPSNREIDQKLLIKLRKSIEKRNLLSERPILVDGEMQVIDGQHRLEIAKSLQIPVYYQVRNDLTPEDIIILNNNQKQWKNTDYLDHYCKQGYENYLKLKDFMDKENMSLKLSLLILNGKNDTEFFKKFRDGRYDFPSPNEINEALEKKFLVHQVKDFIDKKTRGPKGYLDSVHFYSALIEFLNNKNVSFEIFMKKMVYGLEIWRPCTKQIEYFRMFKQIYNWKNHNPLE